MIIKDVVFRNRYNREGKKAYRNRVNLEWFRDKVNLGDCLSPVICEHMLSKKGLSFDVPVSRTKHLMAVGSLLGGRGNFDVTVWGSGLMSFSNIYSIYRKKIFQRHDVRAVRGPITRDALIQCGIDCPEVYGDPAVLMPLVYRPEVDKQDDVVVVLHFNTDSSEKIDGVRYLDIRTSNYQSFLTELCSAKMVISSSLHGIILAETYNVPSVFLAQNREREMMKYYDWYYSTERMCVKVAMTMKEALSFDPMPIPDLTMMRLNLQNSFPYDLWD